METSHWFERSVCMTGDMLWYSILILLTSSCSRVFGVELVTKMDNLGCLYGA
jgi:hypothetical protein